jgi:hypothetical protein
MFRAGICIMVTFAERGGEHTCKGEKYTMLIFEWRWYITGIYELRYLRGWCTEHVFKCGICTVLLFQTRVE